MLTLYTSATPNGHKVSIFLEEAGLPYKVHPISLGDLEQKEPWYLKINPNGRIPALVDGDNDDFAVFESGAILLYLAEKTGKFLPDDARRRSEVIQWLMFQMGGVGPMQGQAHVFFQYAPEKIPYAIERYQKETRRLYEVLNTQLERRDYLVDSYSIADMAHYPWVRIHEWAGVSIDGLPHLKAWMDRMAQREGVIKGLEVPRKEDNKETQKEKIIARVQKML